MDPEDKTVTFQILGSEKYTLKPNPLELCRLCANTDNQLIPIFKGEGLEHDIPSKLEKHLPIIKVTETDKLPLQICYQCASTLIAWHNFYEGSSVADKRLREILAVDEKYQDAGTYEDFGEDFRDDDFDQSHIDLVESIPLNTTSTSSQHEELSQNESASEITQLKNSKILNETARENTTDER